MSAPALQLEPASRLSNAAGDVRYLRSDTKCWRYVCDLSSDGIQNFKNRFSFVSYLLTTGSRNKGLMSVKKARTGSLITLVNTKFLSGMKVAAFY